MPITRIIIVIIPPTTIIVIMPMITIIIAIMAITITRSPQSPALHVATVAAPRASAACVKGSASSGGGVLTSESMC